jgi:hypothetical protein
MTRRSGLRRPSFMLNSVGVVAPDWLPRSAEDVSRYREGIAKFTDDNRVNLHFYVGSSSYYIIADSFVVTHLDYDECGFYAKLRLDAEVDGPHKVIYPSGSEMDDLEWRFAPEITHVEVCDGTAAEFCAELFQRGVLEFDTGNADIEEKYVEWLRHPHLRVVS